MLFSVFLLDVRWYEALLHPNIAPFTYAAVALVCILLLEIVGLALSFSPTRALDAVLPDFETAWTQWLYVGRVPLLALGSLFLLGFSVTGLVIQATLSSCDIPLLSPLMGCLAGTLGGLVSMRALGLFVAGLVPDVQTSAVGCEEFIGGVGHIVIGVARVGMPAQLKLSDRHGNNHYLMVEPESEDVTFTQGEAVQVVSARDMYFVGRKASVRSNQEQ